VFLDTPKWLFISGPDQLAHAKKKRKTTPNQRGIFGALQTNVVKFLQKIIIFYAPKKYSKINRPPEMGTWENC
jgi:hypothetical protein